MSEKNVVIFVKSKPFTRLNYYEALRVAVGLWEHKVSVVWMGDGIYSTLKEADKTFTNKMLDEMLDLEINLFVEEKSLRKRGFDESDVLSGVDLVNQDRITELLLESGASIVF